MTRLCQNIALCNSRLTDIESKYRVKGKIVRFSRIKLSKGNFLVKSINISIQKISKMENFQGTRKNYVSQFSTNILLLSSGALSRDLWNDLVLHITIRFFSLEKISLIIEYVRSKKERKRERETERERERKGKKRAVVNDVQKF